jgi:hypothetical protein
MSAADLAGRPLRFNKPNAENGHDDPPLLIFCDTRKSIPAQSMAKALVQPA